jgi:serine-type D-Ala-D-Ala carboxypeptidase/endopeptidase (penicillin-binding protein 4)
MRVAGLLVACVLCCLASELGEVIHRAIEAEPAARHGFWGIRVVDPRTGEVLHAFNEDKFFVPASNTKLFTTSLALTRLGPDYRFITRVEANAAPDARGTVSELRLIGGGDPNLSARAIPYERNKVGPNPLAAIEALADQAIAAGVREIDGDITGDDTAYLWEPYPDGWAVDDPIWEYGAPVSALTVNDNAFTLSVAPGDGPGTPGVISLWPAIEYFTVHNRTQTVEHGPAKVSISRLPGLRELIVTGTVPMGVTALTNLLAVDDPALFAAMCLRDALLERGVRVRGNVRSVHRREDDDARVWGGIEVARFTSVPLAEALTVVNKVSQNLHTELVLRELARVKDGVGSRSGGLRQIAEYLTEIGVDEGQYNFEDASGLSRLTLVTPATISKVLLFMYDSPHRDTWIRTLPVGGVDGTLATRFEDEPAGADIHAKTGSLSHVSSLSGYAMRKDGRTLVFSIMANNYNGPAAPVRKVVDRIALALLQ